MLPVDALPAAAGAPDVFDFSDAGASITIALDLRGRESVVLSNGYQRIRLDILDGTIRSGPVRIRYRVGGSEAVDRQLFNLKRLLTLQQERRITRDPSDTRSRAVRWTHVLRAIDACATSATQRDIAVVLFPRIGLGKDWRDTDSVRMRVHRLIAAGNEMIAGRYLRLLR